MLDKTNLQTAFATYLAAEAEVRVGGSGFAQAGQIPNIFKFEFRMPNEINLLSPSWERIEVRGTRSGCSPTP